MKPETALALLQSIMERGIICDVSMRIEIPADAKTKVAEDPSYLQTPMKSDQKPPQHISEEQRNQEIAQINEDAEHITNLWKVFIGEEYYKKGLLARIRKVYECDDARALHLLAMFMEKGWVEQHGNKYLAAFKLK